MPKIIRILRSCSMKTCCISPTVNISKLNFWSVICIAKNFIWATLKEIFSIFRLCLHLQIPVLYLSQILSNPTNHTSMDSFFIQLSDVVRKSISEIWPLWLVLWSSGFVVHIWKEKIYPQHQSHVVWPICRIKRKKKINYIIEKTPADPQNCVSRWINLFIYMIICTFMIRQV